MSRFWKSKEEKIIEKINDMDLNFGLHGRVKVQLIDPDNGKVKHEDGGENFISLSSIATMKWWPRYLAMQYGYNYTANAAGFDPRWMSPPFLSHIAAWNDTTAESSGTEYGIQKPIIAWASRWPAAIGSNTSRGLVNTGVSAVTATASTFVFDWNPNQGNGTFKSVGWTRINNTYGLAHANLGRDFTTTNVLDLTTVATLTTWVSRGMYWDGTYFNIADNDGTKFILKNYTTSGGAANATVFNIPTTVNAFNQSGTTLLGMTKISTDWFMCGRNNSNNPCVQKLNSSGTSQWVRNENSGTPATSMYYNDITTDATNLWVACSNGSIYRISTTDGTVAATITPSIPGIGNTMSTGTNNFNGVIGIEYDTNDSMMWILASTSGAGYVLWKINPSTGAVVDSPQITLQATTSQTETATTPYAGSVYNQGSQPGGDYVIGLGGGQFSQTAPATYAVSGTALKALAWSSTSAASITMKGSDLWGNYQAGTSTLGAYNKAVRLIPVENLGTRKLLGSSVVKDTTRAMRITYEFDYTL